MKRSILLAWAGVVAIWPVLAGGARATEVKGARAEHVFIVSFDQAKPDNVERAEMPLFKRMVAEGAHTWEAFTIVPSLTLPGHTSMLTGVGVQKHQILWNDWDAAKPRLAVPTIFQLAKARGLGTAMIVAKDKFKTLEVVGGVDTFIIPEDYWSGGIAAAAVELLKKEQPALTFIHFGDPDFTGHAYGVDSPQKMKAMADCDRALAMILAAIKEAGIADSSVLILTADHGGHDRLPEENAAMVARGMQPQPGTHGSADTADVVIPWVVWGKGVKRGYTVTAPVVQYDTAATALWLLGVPVPEGFWGRPVVTAFE
jgi:predicted AlkP superfamily pyrophosphatase or phosphodiesterase